MNSPHDVTTKPLNDIPLVFKNRYQRRPDPLRQGGIGVIYLAHDRDLGNRLVVVKVLRATFAGTSKGEYFREKFKHELQALIRLTHPGIVKVLDQGELEDGQPFIVMEYIEGGTLAAQMKAGALPPPRVAQLVRQISRALDAAHDKLVLHRDLNSNNIMLQPLGEGAEMIRLIDFGIATVKDSQAEKQRAEGKLPETESQTVVVGTLPYMAPEQLRGKPSALSDIYALGVITYQMLTGRLPFGLMDEEMNAVELYQQQNEGLFPKPSELRPGLPRAVDAVFRKALAFEQSERYPCARDFAAALVRALTPEAKPPDGTGPLVPRFYIVRPTDQEFLNAIGRRDSIVLVKGARQMGKTSLLARGLEQARATGARVVITDLQMLNAEHLQSIEAFFHALADSVADQLDLEFDPARHWKIGRGASLNFSRYLEKEVLGQLSAPLVWALDEVDRLFACSFGSEVFGLFRSWYNRRALDPASLWQRLTLAIAYATEAHLFITDVNQSPFNVGTRLTLADFTPAQVDELNRRYNSPLRSQAELEGFFQQVGGQPYLTRHGLEDIVTRRVRLPDFIAQAEREDGPFGDHLRRLLVIITQDEQLSRAVRAMLEGGACPTPEAFFRLRSAGVMSGETVQEARLRCQLYATYLRKHLL